MNKYEQYTDEQLLEILRQGDQNVMDYLIEN